MTRNKTSILIILLLLFSGCAYYNTFFNAKKFFSEAEKAREKRTRDGTISADAKEKYSKAIGKASRLLEFYPDSKYVDDALFILGKSFFYREEYRKAKRKFIELIENFPEGEYVGEAGLWLGKTNTGLRDYETAEKNFKDILKAKTKRDTRDEAQFLLGGLHFHKEDYIVALSEYKVAAENANDKALRSEAYFQMGECYFELKDYPSAAASYEKARKYSTDVDSDYKAMFRAGITHKSMKEYDRAIDIFRSLLGEITYEENWPECKLEISECLYSKGEIDNAVSWYESIVEDHKRTDEAAKSYYQLGQIYLKEFIDYEKAKEYFDLASKEYSRSEIVPEAKASLKSVQNLIALRKDIVEQEKRIAAGDSVAASMDSLEVVDTSEFEDPDMMTEMMSDSARAAFTDTTMEGYDPENENIPDPDAQFGERENDPQDREEMNQEQRAQEQTQKMSLKKGALGTPEEELIKDKLMLAELYLFEFEQPDSALFEYLEIMERDTTVEVLAKVIYSIGYIFENYKKDHAVADSIFQNLLANYPESIYANKLREDYKLPAKDMTNDLALAEFTKAEKEYLDYNNLNRAIEKYEQVVSKYPTSDYAPKSLLAMGWIYDNDIYHKEKALEIYQQIEEGYPESPYANYVKSKIEAYKKFKDSEGKAAEVDSTALAMGEGRDTGEGGDEEAMESGNVSEMDRESYWNLLRKEMEKFNPRLRNPKRIIK
ncbi:MAG: tetratricopeptide repeat protein [candidate division KSB1 bacterium]|jgi:TolA-binding protein|nr:tetratricopeptide repeat protein [candidate division KSB1 bacterium]